jgi:hypothetical protein
VDNPGAIKVAYTAGYTAAQMPADITLAACELVAYLRSLREKGAPVQSEGLGAYNYALGDLQNDTSGLGIARRHLRRHRRVSV